MRNELEIVLHAHLLHVAVVAKMRLNMLLELFEENVLRIKLAAHRANLQAIEV